MSRILQRILMGLALCNGVMCKSYSSKDICCYYYFYKEWNLYHSCMASLRISPTQLRCDQRQLLICRHQHETYPVGVVVANDPNNCQRLLCEKKTEWINIQPSVRTGLNGSRQRAVETMTELSSHVSPNPDNPKLEISQPYVRTGLNGSRRRAMETTEPSSHVTPNPDNPKLEISQSVRTTLRGPFHQSPEERNDWLKPHTGSIQWSQQAQPITGSIQWSQQAQMYYKTIAKVVVYQIGQNGTTGCCMVHDVIYPNNAKMAASPHHCLSNVCHDGNWTLEEIPGCFQEKEKPCYYKGRLYRRGETFSHGKCLVLTCEGGFWKETHSTNCPGCHVSGHGHILPFSQLMYQLKGTCNYTLIEGIDPYNVRSFVSAKFSLCNHSALEVCPNIVTIRHEHLMVEMNYQGIVTINGGYINLPYSHPSRLALLIWNEDDNIKVYTDRGYLVSYTINAHAPNLSIIVPPFLVNRDLNGLCGNPRSSVRHLLPYVNDHGDQPNTFFHFWNREDSNKCVHQQSCTLRLKQNYAKFCEEMVELHQAATKDCQNSSISMKDRQTCIDFLCDCCKEDHSVECVAKCIADSNWRMCQPDRLINASTTMDVGKVARNYATALEPYIQNYRCFLDQWADIIYDISSSVLTFLAGIKPKLLKKLREISPILAEFLEGITPLLIKAGPRLSQISREFLETLPSPIEKLLSQVELHLTCDMCIWSPKCTNFLKVIQTAEDKILYTFGPIFKSWLLKLENHGSLIMKTLTSTYVSMFQEIEDRMEQDGVLSTICHLTGILTAQFEIPFVFGIRLIIQFLERIGDIDKKIYETREFTQIDACPNGCPFKSEYCEDINNGEPNVTTSSEFVSDHEKQSSIGKVADEIEDFLALAWT